MSKRKQIFLLVIFCILVRLTYTLLAYKDSFSLLSDSFGYKQVSDRIVNGIFDFDQVKFICAPLYPLFISAIRMIWYDAWQEILTAIQILISSFTVIFVYKICLLLFRKETVAVIASILYALYIPLFYFVFTIAQETLFLFFLFGCIYYFLKFKEYPQSRNYVVSALYMFLCYQTKSFVVLLIPFLLIIVLVSIRELPFGKRLAVAGIYAFTVFILSLPVGIWNYKTQHVFTTSSNGGGLIFLAGNCELNYLSVCETPQRGTIEFVHMQNLVDHFHHYQTMNNDSIKQLPQTEKQKAYYHEAFKWIKDNPGKFIQVKINNLVRIIVPGNSRNHYDTRIWIQSLILSAPLYLMACLGLFLAFREDYERHLWIIGVVLAFGFMLVVYIFTNRYRSVTLEGFYIFYAAFGIQWLYEKFIRRRKEVRNS